MKSIKEHISELDKEGLTFLENEYSEKECNYYNTKFSKMKSNKDVTITPRLRYRHPFSYQPNHSHNSNH